MRRLKPCFITLCLLPFILTGCWDRTELNELAITSAAALDLEKEKWVLSYQVIIPSAISSAAGTAGGPTSQVPVVVHSTNGPTIKDAVSKSYLEAPRKLYFGHNSILVIGDKAAKAGFSQIIDLYLRNPDSRETVSVLIAEGDGRSILEQLINMDAIPGQGIQQILEKENQYLSTLPNIRMYELTKQMLSPSKSVLLPEIIISGGKEVTGIDQLKQTTMSSKLRLGRGAIIKNDKLVGWMSAEEALGAAFLGNTINSSTIPFSCQGDSSTHMDSTFLLTDSKTRMSVREKDGLYEITANIKVKGRLNETDCALDLIKPEIIKGMEESIENEIDKMAKKAWSAIQKYNADVSSFSDIIYRKYPKQWKALGDGQDTILKNIKLTIKTEVALDKVGLSNKGYKKLKEAD
jgi:spore germination protein KC